MTRSGGTLIHAAEAYLRMGARSVHAALSHLALNDAAVAERLLSSPIQNVITTNSHPMSQVSIVQQSDRFVVADVSPIFAAVIGSLLR
jgi:ribose-phosphate pyrophosphokinase